MSKTTNKFSPEVRARAVRLVLDHEGEHSSRWAAVTSIAAKIGCDGVKARLLGQDSAWRGRYGLVKGP